MPMTPSPPRESGRRDGFSGGIPRAHRPKAALLTLLFLLTALAALVNPLHRGLRGSYYLSPNWAGGPNLISRERTIGLARLRLEYPNRTANTSILWEGSLYVPASGRYVFSMTSPPDSEVRLDGKVLLTGPAGGIDSREAGIDLDKGIHPVQIRYSQKSGLDQFELLWAPPGKAPRGLESAMLFSEAPRNGAGFGIYRIRQIILPPLLAACVFVLLLFLAGRKASVPGSVGRYFAGSASWAAPKLFAFLLLNGIALNILLSFFCEKTVLDFSGFFLKTPIHAGEDSWRQIANALDYLSSPHERPLYAEIFFARKNKFQYPPTSLLLIEPLRGLPYPKMVAAANFISWLAVIGGSFVLALVLMKGWARPPTGSRYSAAGVAAALILALGFTLTFYPIVKSFEVGQIQTWLYFLFVLALWSWLSGKKTLSGILVGLICLIKPQLGLFALWGLVRGERRFTAGIVGTAGTLGAVSVALFGWANHVDYLRALAFMGKHGESYYTNQSVNGLVNRLIFNGTNLHGNPHAFAPYNGWVYAITLATTALLIAAALFWRPGRGRRVGIEDFLIAALTFTMASPIAWEHHYSILLPIFAAALPAALRAGRERLTVWILAAAFALCSNIYPMINSLANTRLNFLQSHLFFGGLALLIMLYRLRDEGRNAPQGPGQES
jgi:alpha-1,2-mannosyltransferase